MSSSSSSSSSPSSSSSSFASFTTEPLSVGAIQTLPPLEGSVRANDSDVASDWSASPEGSSHCFGFDWVDPKVIEFISIYRDSSSLDAFMDKHLLLKSDAFDNIFALDYCRSTDTICMGRSSPDGSFFFIYSCQFSNLHVVLPFDDFTMGVLRTLNVAPSQLHPNTWASLQAFRLMCDLLCLRPTPCTFMHY